MVQKMNNKTDLEVHIIALKYELKRVLQNNEMEIAAKIKFAILAAEESVKLHKQHRGNT